MRERKIDKKRLVILLVVAVLLIVVLGLFRNLFSGNKKASFDRNYKVSIKVDAVLEDDKQETYKLDVVNLKTGSKIRADFYQRPIYIDGSRTIFDAGGKYKYYNSDTSIRNLENIIGKIDIGEPVMSDGNEKSYNPEVSSDLINSILEALYIGKRTTRNEHVYIVLDDKKIKSFSLYLIGIDGYKDLNITMAFAEVEKKDEFDLPVFYDEVMEKIEIGEIKMIK